MSQHTTVKVSKETASKLAALQKVLNTRTMDETIALLVRKRRIEAIELAFGSDKRPREFSEEDRLESRS